MVYVYIVLFIISYFLSEILRNPTNGSRRNFENFYFFDKLTLIPPAVCKIHGEKQRNSLNSTHHGLEAKRILILELVKTRILSL